MKIFLYFIGKPRDPHANALAAEYLKRANRYARCEMREVRADAAAALARHATARRVLLDPAGRTMTSAQFTAFIGHAEAAGRDLVFLVGGAEGLPAGWRQTGDLLLSLSALTLPHELARVVLAEQIYRAFAGLRGHPYPR